MEKKKLNLNFSRLVQASFLLILANFAFLASQTAFASSETVEITCTKQVFQVGGSCDTFNDATIDRGAISKVEIIEGIFDDFGTVQVISPSGQIRAVSSSHGCPGSGTMGPRDITSLFGNTGIYHVRVTATDDTRCATSLSGWAKLKITTTDCNNPDSPKCDTPGTCQSGPGQCVLANGKETCKYPVSKSGCNADNNDCTYDFCKSSADGSSATCTPGPNVCGGLIPCGRLANDPNTPSNETQPCGLCHLALVINNALNYIFSIASTVALLALIITAFLFVLSGEDPGKRNLAKTALENVIKGYATVFLAWLIVDFVLSAWGYINPIKGNWNVVCSLLYSLGIL